MMVFNYHEDISRSLIRFALLLFLGEPRSG